MLKGMSTGHLRTISGILLRFSFVKLLVRQTLHYGIQKAGKLFEDSYCTDNNQFWVAVIMIEKKRFSRTEKRFFIVLYFSSSAIKGRIFPTLFFLRAKGRRLSRILF